MSCCGDGDWLTLLHVAADAQIALFCLAISAALLYLARRHRAKTLSSVFVIYGLLFLVGGITQGLEGAKLFRGGHALVLWSGVFKQATALGCAASAYVTLRCAGTAVTAFTRLAVLERQIGERVDYLNRRQAPEDAPWRGTLSEILDIARQARSVVGVEKD